MACSICNQFQGRFPIDIDTRSDQDPGQRNFIVPKFTFDELVLSATTCYCCDILLTGSLQCFKAHSIESSNVQHCSVRFYYPTRSDISGEADCAKHLIFYLRDERQFEVEIFATDDDDCPIPDAWDYISTSKRTSPGTDSNEALATIREWISDCIAEHSEDSFCQSPELPHLPKRVVDVGVNSETVRLVETDGAREKYICLSHCWGPTQIIITRLSTLEKHKKSIPWEELSKTFQEAITLTRTLGFRYIWIDSLCIIQDSARDWEIESTKMASIYSDGHLTIAATRSPNGAGGLFSHTPDFKVSGKTPRGEDYCLFFRERIDHQIDAGTETTDQGLTAVSLPVKYTATETHYPLLTRAWVYQERMLSTRVIHFGRYELFFECNSHIRCECEGIAYQGAGVEAPAPLIKIEYADVLAEYHAGRQGQALLDVQYQGARLWRTLVACYTALSLTMSKDRLPAIGGLARQIASGRESTYLAGLWKGSLEDDLLWMVYNTSESLKPRPHPRNAPTWSWASVETSVDYWDVITFSDWGDEGNMPGYEAPYEHLLEVEECGVVKSAIDEFGSIKSGELTVSGLLVEGVLEREVVVHGDKKTIAHYVTFPDIRLPMKADYLLDAEGPYQTKPGVPVYCLRMGLLHGNRNGGLKDHLVSLVLKKSPESPTRYERIGHLKISGNVGQVSPVKGVFQRAELERVVIV